ncbi:hypothetical protein MBLNU459_g4990t1 [Dothideomycetes sp. NU459]
MSPFRKVKTILLVTAQHESATPFDPGFAAIEQAFSSLTDAWNIVMVSKCKRQDLQEAFVRGQIIADAVGGIVVAMKGLVREDAAAQFAQFFYRTLGSGWSFWRSYEEILNRLRNDPAMSRFYGRIDPVIFYPQQL